MNTTNLKSAKRIGFVALSVFFLFLLLFPTGEGICFKDADGRTLAKIPLSEEKFFEVEFLHSVNRGHVIERYAVDFSDKTVALSSGWFESYGAGMFDTITPDMKIGEDRGMLRIDFPLRKMNDVTYRSTGNSKHFFDNGIVRFEMFPYFKTSALTLRAEKMNIAEHLWYFLTIERSYSEK